MARLTLAIDTCFDACSAAVRVEGSPPRVAARRKLMSSGHAEALMPMIAEVLAEVKEPARDIDRILVTHGPGTFTGTRIAVAAARGLALATGAEIAAMSSLRVMGLAALAGRPDLAALLVVAALRNGEVYAEAVARASAEQPQLMTFAGAAKRAAAEGLPLLGTGAGDVASAALTLGLRLDILVADTLPDARTLLSLAADPGLVAGKPRPLYLRPPDAKPSVSQALPRIST